MTVAYRNVSRIFTTPPNRKLKRMYQINRTLLDCLLSLALFATSTTTTAQSVEPTWESLAENYQVPEWFVDGKLGVWFHWGVSSAADENRPHDGSHYGRHMYSPPELGKADKDLSRQE